MRKILTMLSAASIAMVANAEPFTYQGQLKDGGQPANGAYDLVFQLMDAPIGGSTVGIAENLEDVDVVDGVFQVLIDFNAAFDGSPRWINVAVRDGASTGFYNTLLPRQLLTAAPEAQHALVADTALNVPWVVAPGVIVYGDGNDKVFINRLNGISDSDYFGVHANSAGFVGMIVSGAVGARPYYGYSVNNALNAYSYFDPGTDEWRLWNSGDALVVDADHDLHVGKDVNADAFRYKSPKTSAISVSGNSFVSGSSNEFIASFGTGGAFQSEVGSGWLVAPVQLPQGAVLQKMTAYVGDTVGPDISVRLQYQTHGGNATVSVFDTTSTGQSGSDLTLIDSSPASGYELVDNFSGHYHLHVLSIAWPASSSMRISSVVIEYTIDEAN